MQKPFKQPFVIKVSYTTLLMFLLLARNTSSQSTGTSQLPPITPEPALVVAANRMEHLDPMTDQQNALPGERSV